MCPVNLLEDIPLSYNIQKFVIKLNRFACFRRAKVGILSTGNELQAPHEDLKPGHVRDSNKLALLNLLKQYGFEGSDCGVARDKYVRVFMH